MNSYLKLLLDELQMIRTDVASGNVNPMEYKQRLAKELVSKYHGQDSLLLAEDRFNRIHRQKLFLVN